MQMLLQGLRVVVHLRLKVGKGYFFVLQGRIFAIKAESLFYCFSLEIAAGCNDCIYVLE